MSVLHDLESRVREQVPGVETQLDVANTTDGSSWLDVRLTDRSVNIEWRPGRGFGVSAFPESVYGEGSDELYPDVDTALDRVLSLLRTGSNTNPNRPTLVKQLRQTLDLSQEELAARMNVRQSAISRLERRADVLLSTLRQVVAAMGGTLEIRAKFPHKEVSVDYVDLLADIDAADARQNRSRRNE